MNRANIVKGLVFAGYKISVESRFNIDLKIENYYIVVEGDNMVENRVNLNNFSKPIVDRLYI